jgi:hypothetical protein
MAGFVTVLSRDVGWGMAGHHGSLLVLAQIFEAGEAGAEWGVASWRFTAPVLCL